MSIFVCVSTIFFLEFVSCSSAKDEIQRSDVSAPIKTPTILKVLIKRNVLGDEMQKWLNLYTQGQKTQNLFGGYEGSQKNPMLDYFEKFYTFGNYDLLRPYRSIFQSLKTLKKQEQSTQSWLRFLKHDHPTEDYWSAARAARTFESRNIFFQPRPTTKLPYHRLRETMRIMNLNGWPVRITTTPSSSSNSTHHHQKLNSNDSTTHHYHVSTNSTHMNHTLIPPWLEGNSGKIESGPIKFCEKPCDNYEVDTHKIPPSTSATIGSTTTGGMNPTAKCTCTTPKCTCTTEKCLYCCTSTTEKCTNAPAKCTCTQEDEHGSDSTDEDNYEDVQVFAPEDSTEIMTLNTKNVLLGSHRHPKPTKTPPTKIKQTTTKPPRLRVITGTESDVWTVSPNPILDRFGGAATPSQGRSINSHSSSMPAQTTLPVPRTNPEPSKCSCRATCGCTDTSTCGCRTPAGELKNMRKPQKIIVRISASLGEVPVVIMRDNNCKAGVSLSLVNDIILDEHNHLRKCPSLNTNRKQAHSRNKSRSFTFPKVSKKTFNKIYPQEPLRRPVIAMPQPLYPFQMDQFPIDSLRGTFGFPDTQLSPALYPRQYDMRLKPRILPIYFSNGNFLPPSSNRYLLGPHLK